MEYPEDRAGTRPPRWVTGILPGSLLKKTAMPDQDHCSWGRLSARPREYLEADDKEDLHMAKRSPRWDKTAIPGDHHAVLRPPPLLLQAPKPSCEPEGSDLP
eukprot:g24355.t1